VVPWLGVGGEEGRGAEIEDLFIRENRDCTSLNWDFGEDVDSGGLLGLILSLWPIPKPGTDMPALPSLLTAP
jgi:hypothetical protein